MSSIEVIVPPVGGSSGAGDCSDGDDVSPLVLAVERMTGLELGCARLLVQHKNLETVAININNTQTRGQMDGIP